MARVAGNVPHRLAPRKSRPRRLTERPVSTLVDDDSIVPIAAADALQPDVINLTGAVLRANGATRPPRNAVVGRSWRRRCFATGFPGTL